MVISLLLCSCENGKKAKQIVTPQPVVDMPCVDSSKINLESPCTMNWEPVCGCDGVTYGNACGAENAGVTSYEKGGCEK